MDDPMDYSQSPEQGQVRHRLSSSWNVQAAAGDPFAAVRVKNLQTVVQAGQDAWGRPGRAQPLLVSAEVCFACSFGAAASADRLGADTVHYGTMSKAILESLETFGPGRAASSADADADTDSITLRRVLDRIWARLTGLTIAGETVTATGAGSTKAPLPPPLLDIVRVRFLSVTARLPKASLLGEGVSLTGCAVFDTSSHRVTRVQMAGVALRLHALRVPTLIGVNANERLARQFVVATVEVDMFDLRRDVYAALERVVVKAMEESSFDTLEALAAKLADTIETWSKSVTNDSWQIRVRLEKPTAVPFADCPEVEVRVGTDAPATNILKWKIGHGVLPAID